MTTKLSLYNGALVVLGETKLATVTDNVVSRKKLDDIWDNNLRERVLEHGQWNFAARSVQLEFSPSTTPSFGYTYAFDKPTDFVRTMAVCSDVYYDQPIIRIADEANWWFTDLDTIYVKYVSKDTQWGLDLSLWPGGFTEYVEHYLAWKVAPRLTGVTESAEHWEKLKDRMLLAAKSIDAMESSAKFAPRGGWGRSRAGFRGGNHDRGSRSQLIG